MVDIMLLKRDVFRRLCMYEGRLIFKKGVFKCREVILNVGEGMCYLKIGIDNKSD